MKKSLHLVFTALLLASSHGFSEENAEETLSPAVINSNASIEFSGYSVEMSKRLAKWNDYTEPRRFLQHLQVQMSHASSMASKLGGMESLFDLVSDTEMRIHALKQMHMHYTDAYDDYSLRWETTRKIVENRPDLESQIMVDVQAVIEPYMRNWVAPRLAAFEAEIKKIEPDYSLDFTMSVQSEDFAKEEETVLPVAEKKSVPSEEPAAAPSCAEREWESRDGKRLTASFVRFVDSETVELKVGGRIFDLKISKLSDADREFLGDPPSRDTDGVAAASEERPDANRVEESDSDDRSSARSTRQSGTALRDLGIIGNSRAPVILGTPTGRSPYSPSEAARREMQRYQQHLDRTMAPRR